MKNQLKIQWSRFKKYVLKFKIKNNNFKKYLKKINDHKFNE